MASLNFNGGLTCPEDPSEGSEATFPPHRPKVQHSDQHGYSAPSLSVDSGTYSIEPCQMLDCRETFRPDSRDLCDQPDMNGFSEEELLNITFEACDTTGQGEVLASTVMQYLRAMTGHSPGQDKLTVLQRMLDPEDQDHLVSRDTFHTTMRRWIAQCSQDGESSDLLGLVAQLKHAQHRLSGQNSSLLKTVSQCEEANLQLTLEVSELRSKLASAQLCVVRARSLSEELDEARRALRESQERATKALANSHALEELEETRVLLAVREREITKSLQSDLMRLQEHSQQALLRFDKCALSPPGLKRGVFPNHYSLHHEILEAQPRTVMEEMCGSMPEILPPPSPREDIQNIIHKIKSADLKHLLHAHLSERDAVCNSTAESLERACSQEQQQQASSKQHFLTIVKELEVLRAPWEEQEHRLAEAKRQAQEARRAAAITWWRALRLEGERSRAAREAQEATGQMQERILTLEAQLREVQLEKEQRKCELRDTQSQAVAEKQDKAVETEMTGDISRDEAESRHVEAEKLLESLRRVEAVVGRALQVAQHLTEEQSRVKERLEAISRRVEDAVSRATHTQRQLGALEARMSTSTPSSDISIHSDASPADVGHSAVGSRCSIAGSELESVSQHSSPSPPSPVTGGSLLHAGAEDNSHKGCDNKEASQDTDDSTDSSDPWVNYLSAVLSQAPSSDLLPVGLVSKQSPPEQNTCERGSAAAHSPLPETSPLLGPACEELTHRHTWENVAGSEEPDCGEGSASKFERSESSTFALEDVDSGQTTSPEGNECLRHKQEDSGRSQGESASSGSLELEHSGESTGWELVEKGKPQEKNNRESFQAFSTTDLKAREGALETSGSSKKELESSGRIQEEASVNGVLQEPQTSWTGHAKELGSGKEQRSETSQTDIVQASQPQTADPAGTLKHAQDTSAVCGASGSAAKQASPRGHPLVVPEPDTPFIFPHTRSRPSATPAMPTLPEEEEDSPEEIDSSSSSPSSYVPVETKLVNVSIAPPAIVLPRQVSKQEPSLLEKARPHSPRPRLSRNTGASGPITTVDNDGHVIDLVKDQLPEMQLSEEDRQKNLELLEEAKKVSDRFLTRRGRRSTCSLTESPTALSPNPTPGSSPVPSRSSSFSAPPQTALPTEVTISPPTSPPTSQRLEVPAVRDHGETNKPDQESLKRLVDWKPPEKRKVSSGTLTPRHAASAPVREPSVAQKDSTEPIGPVDRGKMPGPAPAAQKPDSQTPATGVAKPVPRPPTQQAPCTAEIKTIGAFPPLMRAVSWDTVGSMNMRNGAPKGDEDLSLSDKLKSSGYKDFPAPPIQKLSKLREEHKLIRNQSISGSKLPDLSEMAEQERGPSSPTGGSPTDEESKEKADAMPNISDVMLRKLKLHRGLPGCAPPLTEKEVENAFVQLSLAFRNDNYTLETRLKQAERERNLTEENTEKELEEFKNSLKSMVSMWQNAEQRESYQRLIETLAVMHRLANRLSSRAEMVGAVRQEKRMNKATEVMLQYVENLKRTYEKDHAELMEFKKLANQNSNRCSSIETGDDGVPRASRSMSLTMGKALPRRRVSVAVVPKFNLLNVPGQTPAMAGPGPVPGAGLTSGAGLASGGSSAGPGALPVLCEANSVKIETPSDPAQPVTGENGKVLTEQEGEAATPAKASCSLEEIRAEIKAKIEEEAYNKGYQEGLKRLKELQEVKEEEEKAEEKLIESEEITGEDFEKEKKPNSKYEEALEVLDRICPKIFKRNRTLWIVLTLFLVMFLVVNLVNLFSYHYSVQGDTSAEKAAIPGKKKFLGLHVGSKSPTPE
ncbi:uncharacterized protein [Salminus brasiliensis]|uniref:uncharacterized protein n=1 Tax=Salminus brasiliensis TaxID=930266 RepID=UPI003B831A0F